MGQGARVPSVKWSGAYAVPHDNQPPIKFDVPLQADETRWLVLRVSDPEQAAVDAFGDYGTALAYSSPFFLQATSGAPSS